MAGGKGSVRNQGAPGNRHSQSATRVESGQKVRTVHSTTTPKVATANGRGWDETTGNRGCNKETG